MPRERKEGKTVITEREAAQAMRFRSRKTLFFLPWVAVAILLFFTSAQSASAFAEVQEIVSSGERLMGLWQDMLSGECQFVHQYKPAYYGVDKYRFIAESFRFDIQRTTSLVSPYRLTISFKAEYKSNEQSPSANATSFQGQRFGFKTAAQAEANVAAGDFGEGHIFDYSIFYVYQSGFWIYKGATQGSFDFNIETFLRREANAQKFQRLLKVPLKTE